MQVQAQVADGTIMRPFWGIIAVTSSFLSYKSTPTITSLKTKLKNMKLKIKKNGSLDKFIANWQSSETFTFAISFICFPK